MHKNTHLPQKTLLQSTRMRALYNVVELDKEMISHGLLMVSPRPATVAYIRYCFGWSDH